MKFVRAFYGKSFGQTLTSDLTSGLIVFLVALPLCLGIALASGAELFTGLITGIVGGLIVSLLSGTSLSVSGPAAGLTAIVLAAIGKLGYEQFVLAVVLAGVLQLIMGFVKAGYVSNYFPTNVIKGMLAAIGIILILKQIPHAMGYDADYEGDLHFEQPDHENSFSGLITAINKSSFGAMIISGISLLFLIIWEVIKNKKLKRIPGPLVVVIMGAAINEFFVSSQPDLALGASHLVNLPISDSADEFFDQFVRPDWSGLTNIQVYVTAVTLALVASIETLLSVEAIDKLDTLKRQSDKNKELLAQGTGNIIAGLLGGLPMTAVIVRGSANVSSGGKTKLAGFFHGVFLLLVVVFIPDIINKIPKASLAAILLMIGYKLTKVELFTSMFKAGWDQFIPFVVTIVAIVLTDLLTGIGIGLGVSGLFILFTNLRNPYFYHKEVTDDGHIIKIALAEEVSFLNKANILMMLEKLPEDSIVTIDGSQSRFIDYDVLEVIKDFQEEAKIKNIDLRLHQIKLDGYRIEEPLHESIGKTEAHHVSDKESKGGSIH